MVNKIGKDLHHTWVSDLVARQLRLVKFILLKKFMVDRQISKTICRK